MRSKAQAERVINQYADTVRRICFLYLKNHSDVEDIFQEVFLKYVLYEKSFESDAHEKAWFIRVTINACKDVLKSFFRRCVSSLEEMEIEPHYIEEDNSHVMEALLKLPDKYKNVIYMHYYEGFGAVEIAKILKKNENTIYTWLARAREKLKKELGGEALD